MATKRELMNCIAKLQKMVEEMRQTRTPGDLSEEFMLNELITEMSEKLELFKEDLELLSKYL